MAGRFTHILVPTDFSLASHAALACAKDLALRFNSRLTLLHAVNDPLATGVWTPDVYVPATPEIRDGFLRTTKERLEAMLTTEERARFTVTFEARIGVPAAVIEDFAIEQKIDLIVMGTHGRRGLKRLAMGSDAEMVLRRAPVPVLVVRDKPESS